MRFGWVLVLLVACDNAAAPAVPSGALDGNAIKPAVAAPPPPVVLSPPIDAQASVEGARDRAIELLERHEYEDLIMKLARPSDLEEFLNEQGGIERVAADFGKSEKPAELLDLLLRTRGKTPRFDDDGKSAHFDIDDPNASRHELTFERVEGRWYLHN